jgi:hypothetical protein
MLSYFKDQFRLTILNFESIENWWKDIFELNVNDGSNDGSDLSSRRSSGLGLCCITGFTPWKNRIEIKTKSYGL